MKLTDEDIAKFQALCESEFGIKIDKQCAYEKGIKLLRLMSAVYQPMTEKEYEFVQKRRIDTLPLLKSRVDRGDCKKP
jgi:hypothetical protein